MNATQSQPPAAGQAAHTLPELYRKNIARREEWSAVGNTNRAFGIKTTRWSLRNSDGDIVADFGPGLIGNTVIGRRATGASEEDCKLAALACNSHAALVAAAQETLRLHDLFVAKFGDRAAILTECDSVLRAALAQAKQ